MPSWSEILKEIQAELEKGNKAAYDVVRRKYLASLSAKTKRNTILYATKWTQTGNVDPRFITISEEDMQGFMEVIHGSTGKNLDLILHTPGGSAEATAAIVSYIRSKFENIRIIIPHAAMSAGTMLACASDQIIMGKHSFIGPIDTQMQLQTPLGFRSVPAQAILDQFKMAKEECQDPKKLGSWLPILNQYGPTLLVESQNALDLSMKLVSEWLEIYMFKGQPDAKELATCIAGKLANHNEFKSHGYHISLEQAKAMKLKVDDLENDQEFQDLVLSVFHATTLVLEASNTAKIIENNGGKAFIKQFKSINPPRPSPSPKPT